jgi:hypothetical protein
MLAAGTAHGANNPLCRAAAIKKNRPLIFIGQRPTTVSGKGTLRTEKKFTGSFATYGDHIIVEYGYVIVVVSLVVCCHGSISFFPKRCISCFVLRASSCHVNT